MPRFPVLMHTALDATDSRELAEFYRAFLGLRYRAADEPPGDGSVDDARWLVLVGESLPSNRSNRSPGQRGRQTRYPSRCTRSSAWRASQSSRSSADERRSWARSCFVLAERTWQPSSTEERS
jgi:hypothetical protein